MPLSAGVRLGPYEVLAKLGEGGMGEVYRARDTRLDRSVAIKVLSEHAAGDPDRRRRFEQEARAISALNHPHICTLHDIGEAVPSTPDSQPPSPESRVPNPEPVQYLVMECVDGETLARRLEKGPLPIDDVLRYGAEVADALAAAHRLGIIHRDLKPANVMLTKSGVKLLDFGLAKLKGPAADQTLALSAMATGAAPATAEGTLLGTLSYMAPEQVEGRDADARTDLFAFGALVYEMATGRRAFEGGSAASVIAAILDREPPPLSAVAPSSPPMLDRIIRACLAKHADDRVQSARDLVLQLTWLRDTAGSGAQATAGPLRPVPRRLRWLAATSVFFAVAAIAAVWFAGMRSAPSAPRPVVRFTIDVPAGRRLEEIAFAPDGQALAYVGTEGGRRRVYLHRMDQSASAPLPGTEGAGNMAISFSPDGRWIGFVSGASVRKVPVNGGEPVTVVQGSSAVSDQTPGNESALLRREGAASSPVPATSADWSSDGTFLFSLDSSGIWRLAPSAAAPVRVTTTDAARGEYAHASPTLLPDGRHVLVTVHTGMQFDPAPLVAVDAATGQQQRLLPEGVGATYLADGYLLYASGSSLFAAPFDPVRIRLGDATPVVDDLGRFTATPLYAISRSGDLAYVPAEPARPSTVVRIDRLGREQVVTELPEGASGAISLSPDARRLAIYRSRSRRMWPSLIDLTRGIPEELSLDRNAHALVWLPDSQRFVFSSDRDGAANLFVRDAASAGGSEKLVTSQQHGDPGSWTRDGLMLAYAEVSPTTSWDLWVYDASTRKAAPFLRTAALERNPAISPDGRWLAYCSNSSGREEIYAEAFPAGGRRVKISADGGWEPLWSADGREVFYRSETALMRVGFAGGQDLNPGKPVPLFPVAGFSTAITYGPVSYAAAADGKSFYFLKPAPVSPGPARIHVVLGWLGEFTRSLKR